MMPFIVETPATHPGIRLYICRAEPPSRSLVLQGIKSEAIRFRRRIEAEVAIMRFSSLYGLLITEVVE